MNGGAAEADAIVQAPASLHHKNGRRATPPVALPGTVRAELLARGDIMERSVPLEALRRAARIWLINSVRGWRRAVVVDIVTGKR